MELIQLKPWRQTWLTPELLHSAPDAELCMIGGKQYAQLTHPRGGPLTCVENRTGRTATNVVRADGKWCWAVESIVPVVDEPPQRNDRAQFEARFPPPGSVHWDGSEYVARSETSYSADRYIGQWAAWKAAMQEVRGERND